MNKITMQDYTKVNDGKSPSDYVMAKEGLVPALVFFKDGDSEILGYVPRYTQPANVFINPDWENNADKPIDYIIVCDSIVDILTLWR